MFYFHFKSFFFTFFYLFLSFSFFFFLHFFYLDIFIYFFFFKYLHLSPLFAIHFYEILFANLSLSLILSLLVFLPILPLFSFIFIISGLFVYEFIYLFVLWRNLVLFYLFDLFLFLNIILPILFLYFLPHPNIIQIYSYNNITHLFIQLFFIWIIWSNIIRKEIKRAYIPLLILLMSIFIIPPDIKTQITFIVILIFYVEILLFLQSFFTLYNTYYVK